MQRRVPDARILRRHVIRDTRRREAGEHREAERAAHHERGVHDARREAGVARLDVTHRGQEHRVERHAGTEPEQKKALWPSALASSGSHSVSCPGFHQA